MDERNYRPIEWNKTNEIVRKKVNLSSTFPKETNKGTRKSSVYIYISGIRRGRFNERFSGGVEWRNESKQLADKETLEWIH